MEMLKSRKRNRSRRALRGLGKDQIAQLGKHGGGKAQQTIGQQQPHGHNQHGLRLTGLDVQRIDQMLEQDWHAHIG